MKKPFKYILIGVIGIVIGFFGSRLVNTEKPEPMIMDHSMMGAMNQSVDDMKKLEGDEFDKKFIEEMIVHHQGAVDMARAAQSKSTREEIRALSADIISAQTKEISMMKQWLAEWFSN